MEMDTVKQNFEEKARIFDSFIVQHIPDYRRMLDAVIASIPFEHDAHFKAIDLGCGTGTLTKLLSDAFPHAELTGMDIADNMLAMARAKLGARAGCRFVAGDLQTYEFDNRYDVVMSSLALHHLRTDADKQAVYKRIFDALTPGGVFFNADIVLSSDAFLEQAAMGKWKEYLMRSIPEAEVETVWIPQAHEQDRPARLMDQLDWLRRFGFTGVDVVWKYYNFAVYGGRKPSLS